MKKRRMIAGILACAMLLGLEVQQAEAMGEIAASSEKNPSMVSLAAWHSAAIKEDGSLWTWGGNDSGRLGDGTNIERFTPVKIMDDTKSVSLGDWHSAAIKEDGSLWTWGDNSQGELGDGTKLNCSRPLKVMDHVRDVSLGTYFSAAIKEDGSLWTWGSNYTGELGDGTKTARGIPKKIMESVRDVELGSGHSAAIKEDGSLWTWGYNPDGRIGDGTTIDRDVPVKIMDHVKSVSLGAWHSAAVKEDGSLWLWGFNMDGRLGDGTKTDRLTPVKIMDDVKDVCAGYGETAVIKTDGSLWKWGGAPDNNGSRPEKIMDHVKRVSIGQGYYAVIKTDGNLWMWGRNEWGQLGDGTTKMRETPVKIMEIETPMLFQDMQEEDWFYDAVYYVNKNQIMTGLNASTFAPAQNVSRGQFATILYRMEQSPDVSYTNRFKDVLPEQFYTSPVLWASADEVKVVNGYQNGNFGPADDITREQMAVMMYRYADYKGYDTKGRADLTAFPDEEKVSAFSREAMEWAVAAGLISGNKDGTLAPQGKASRAVCATIMMRFMEN